MKRGSPLLWSYRIGTTLMTPAASGLLLWRRGKGKEDPTRLG